MIDSMFNFIIAKKLESTNNQKYAQCHKLLNSILYILQFENYIVAIKNNNKHRMQSNERITIVFMIIIDESFNVYNDARVEKHMFKFSRV